MKTALHPKYNTQATIKCMNCGYEWIVGNTKENVEIEICSKCHPFFTGKKVLIDTEGRVDKFKKKLEGATGRKKKDRKKTTLADKVNQELAAQFEKAKVAEAKAEQKKADKAAAKAEKKAEAATTEEAPAETPAEENAE